ncbi:MAG: sulfatase [Verrucomicrobia bacterium]|nr:sulfatase [Verrucomicrobiota bacterium]
MKSSLIAIVLFTATLAQAGDAARPNFIFLLTDDQRYDDLGCTGNTVIQTPHLDALARRGVLFRRFYVTSSVCMASRASYFTGRVERSHACNFYHRNLSPAAWAHSYPVLLRQAGYRTGFIGKFGVTVDGHAQGLPKSDFDCFDGFGGQGDYFPRGKNGPHLERIMGDQAVAFLQNSAPQQKPFCLSVSFKAPHLPLQPDPSFASLYRDAQPFLPHPLPAKELAGLPPVFRQSAWYARLEWLTWFSAEQKRREFILQRYRLIAGVDAAVGCIVAELQKLGLEKNTVILFASDNGYYHGEHGLSTKFYLHEESIRVPLIIVDPALSVERRGKMEDRPTANTDVAPTLLDRAGLTPPAVMQGRSLMPLLQRKTTQWRDAIFCENIIKERRPMCDAIRTADWKYIAYFETNPLQEELYHLATDPRELQNLADDPGHAETKQKLRARLQAMRVQLSGDSTGFPAWIQTQKENTSNWQGYRDGYLKLRQAKQEKITP